MGKVGEFGLSTYGNQTEEENTKRVSESRPFSFLFFLSLLDVAQRQVHVKNELQMCLQFLILEI